MHITLTSRRLPCRPRPLCLALAMVLHNAAIAQNTPVSPDESPDALPGITVQAPALRSTTEGTQSYTTGRTRTATPLSLSLRDTPQSVTVVTRQRIEDQSLQTITDVLNNTTGVSVHQYETNRAQFSARGFNINTLMIDGVPTSWEQPWSSGELMTSLATYDRVEVVRGATGLTTGTGDPSAAINLVRKRASSKSLQGLAEVGIGTWNQRKAQFDLSTPVNDSKTVRARVAGEYNDRDSWVSGLSNASKTIYATMEADLGAHTVASVGISHQDNDSDGAMWGGLPVWYSDGGRTNWPVSKTTSADWVRWDSQYQNAFATLSHNFDSGWKAEVSVSRGRREADSYLLYMYGSPDRDTGLGLMTWPGSYRVETVQDDASIQFSGPFKAWGMQHELTVGYVHSRQDFDADSRAATGGAAPNFNNWTGSSVAEPVWGPLSYYGQGTTTQEAVYGVTRINVTDTLRMIAGARLSSYEKKTDDVFGTGYSIRHHGELTPYAGVIHDLNEQHSIFLSHAQIFKPQKERDINARVLDPIKGSSTELGIKGEYFGGRLNAAASVFRIKQDNLAQSVGLTIPGTTPPETAYRAAEGVTSEGFEFEVAGEPSPGWRLSAGYSQFKATDADNEDVNTMYPRKLLRVFSTYRLRDDWSNLTVGAGVNWQSSTYTIASNPLGTDERIEQKAYALINLMARYDISAQMAVQLNVNNVFNRKYFAVFDAYDQLTYGAPRHASLTLTYRF